jgi:hypothetical protein
MGQFDRDICGRLIDNVLSYVSERDPLTHGVMRRRRSNLIDYRHWGRAYEQGGLTLATALRATRPSRSWRRRCLG